MKRDPLHIHEHFEHSHERFINRELSWLQFNMRVLEEAENPEVPLLERIKFLSISASNLDEFYMVRVAGIREQIRNKISKKSQDGLTPSQQLRQIRESALDLMLRQQRCLQNLKKELVQEGVSIINPQDITRAERKWLEEYFLSSVFPALTPIAVDPTHPFPFLPNLGLAIVLQLAEGGHRLSHRQAIIPLPPKLSRFIRIEGSTRRIIALESVIELFKEHLFPGNNIIAFGLIRIVRDSDLEIEEEAEDLVSHFESAVKKRRRGRVILLKISDTLPAHLRKFVVEELRVSPKDVMVRHDMLGLANLMELYNIPKPTLKFTPYQERFPERINDYHGDCFAAIAAKDIVVHHPYETFDVVVSFLEQAAKDPDVIAIKQTLYRTSSDSPIVKALIQAAEAGKSVTVVVELKARFDEEANIRWARDLERAGAQVTFGLVGLKTHCKVSLVARQEGSVLRSYVHFGTGNYHPQTAKVYSDLSFFTCDPDLCKDTTYLFNYLTGYSLPKSFLKLAISPLSVRKTLLSLIDEEIEFARSGKPATIWAKMNALLDPQFIDKLYEASQAGVKIELIIRGMCGLRPGIKGFSENITVRSMVGRFLEHPRILCFGAGAPLPSREAKVFLSSGDWMSRNLDHRVEVLVPIENPTVHEQILEQIMLANLRDTKQSWTLGSDGTYTRMPKDKQPFSAHEYFMTNPSLSGRGKALTQDATFAQRQKIHQLFKPEPEDKA